MTIQEKIQNKKTYLGIEFGSTRIKAVLIDDKTDINSFEQQLALLDAAAALKR